MFNKPEANKPAENNQAAEYVSEEGVFLNSNDEVVYGKDPDRKVQIVPPGGTVTPDLASRYNIVQPSEDADAEDAPDQAEPAPAPAPKNGNGKAAGGSSKAK